MIRGCSAAPGGGLDVEVVGDVRAVLWRLDRALSMDEEAGHPQGADLLRADDEQIFGVMAARPALLETAAPIEVPSIRI